MRSAYECVSKHSTLCWDCEKACGKCSWSREFKPIKGWRAIPTQIYQYTTLKRGKHYRYSTDSFDVYECPEFEPLKMQSEEEFLKLLNLNEAEVDQDDG